MDFKKAVETKKEQQSVSLKQEHQSGLQKETVLLQPQQQEDGQRKQEQSMPAEYRYQGEESLDASRVMSKSQGDGIQAVVHQPAFSLLGSQAELRSERILSGGNLTQAEQEEIEKEEKDFTLMSVEEYKQILDEEESGGITDEELRAQGIEVERELPAGFEVLEGLKQELEADHDSASPSFTLVKTTMDTLLLTMKDAKKNERDCANALFQLRNAAVQYYNTHRGHRYSGKGKRRKDLINRIISASQEAAVHESTPQSIRNIVLDQMLSDQSREGFESKKSKEFFRELAKKEAGFDQVDEYSYKMWFRFRHKEVQGKNLDRDMNIETVIEKTKELTGIKDRRVADVLTPQYEVNEAGEPVSEQDRQNKAKTEEWIERIQSPDLQVRKPVLDAYFQEILQCNIKPEMVTRKYMLEHYDEMNRLTLLTWNFPNLITDDKLNKAYFESLPGQVKEALDKRLTLIAPLAYEFHMIEQEKNTKKGVFLGEVDRRALKADKDEAFVKDFLKQKKVALKEEPEEGTEPYQYMFIQEYQNMQKKPEEGLNLDGLMQQEYQTHTQQAEGFAAMFRKESSNVKQEIMQGKIKQFQHIQQLELPDSLYANGAHLEDIERLFEKKKQFEREHGNGADGELRRLEDTWKNYLELVTKQTQLSLRSSALIHTVNAGMRKEGENGELSFTPLSKEEQASMRQEYDLNRVQEDLFLDQIHKLYNELAGQLAVQPHEKLKARELYEWQEKNRGVTWASFHFGESVMQYYSNLEFTEEEEKCADIFLRKYDAGGSQLKGKLARLVYHFRKPYQRDASGNPLNEEEAKKKAENDRIFAGIFSTRINATTGEEEPDYDRQAKVLEEQIDKLIQFPLDVFELSMEMNGYYLEQMQSFLSAAFMFTGWTTSGYCKFAPKVLALIPEEKREFMNKAMELEVAYTGALPINSYGVDGTKGCILSSVNKMTANTEEISTMIRITQFLPLLAEVKELQKKLQGQPTT